MPDGSWSNDEEMFDLIHQMRVRIITAPSFTGRRILAAILFERDDGRRGGRRSRADRAVAAQGSCRSSKMDKGLEDEADGVQLMKPLPGLDALLDRAQALGVFGTKMRSVVKGASPTGIAAIVQQQFAVAAQISGHGLMPILEPEVSLKAADRGAAETILHDELRKGLDALSGDTRVMLKLTIPAEPDLYADLIGHHRVARVVALSGGYSRAEACNGAGEEPRPDRQLQPGAARGPAPRHGRRRVRCRVGRRDRRDLRCVDRQDVMTEGAVAHLLDDPAAFVAAVERLGAGND